MSTLDASIQQAVTDGKLLAESAKNIHSLLAKSSSPIDRASIEELAAAGNWAELNNRKLAAL